MATRWARRCPVVSAPADSSIRGLSRNWRRNQTSQEFQFIGTWDQFDVTVGALWYNEKVTDYRQSNLTGPGLVGPVSFIQPSTLAFCVNLALDYCPTTNATQGAESDSYGIYAQGNYRPAFARRSRTHARTALHGRPEGRQAHVVQQPAGEPAGGVQRVARRSCGSDQVQLDRRHPDVPALRHGLPCGWSERSLFELHQLRRGGERGLGARLEVTFVRESGAGERRAVPEHHQG